MLPYFVFALHADLPSCPPPQAHAPETRTARSVHRLHAHHVAAVWGGRGGRGPAGAGRERQFPGLVWAHAQPEDVGKPAFGAGLGDLLRRWGAVGQVFSRKPHPSGLRRPAPERGGRADCDRGRALRAAFGHRHEKHIPGRGGRGHLQPERWRLYPHPAGGQGALPHPRRPQRRHPQRYRQAGPAHHQNQGMDSGHPAGAQLHQA